MNPDGPDHPSFLAERRQIPALAGPSVQMVAATLSARIASGEYPQGSRMPAERQLAASLGVARNTVREALDLLAGQGLVARRAGAGSFVTDPQGRDDGAPVAAATGPLHLQVMRGILEPEMVRLAIINMPPAAIDQLAATVTRMTQTDDPPRLARLEEEFRLILAEATGNPLLLACYHLVVKAGRQRHRAGLLRRRLTPEGIAATRADHAALAEALTDRDIARALDLVGQMLLDEQRVLMQAD